MEQEGLYWGVGQAVERTSRYRPGRAVIALQKRGFPRIILLRLASCSTAW
jgi:hypothetical protein